MTGAALAVAATRGGPSYWFRSWIMMMRFVLVSQRRYLIFTLVIQTLMGAGMAVMYGLYFGEVPPEPALFIATGAPTLALVPIGMAVVPSIILQRKLDGSYDFVWSLPVPRSSALVADFTVFTFLAMPGTALTLLVATWRYDLDLKVSLLVIPAVMLVSLMSASVGTAFAHAIPNPRVTNLIINLIIFAALLFSPVAFPIDQFPTWLANVHRVLPFFAMADAIRAGLTEGIAENVTRSFVVLALWCTAAWTVTGWVVGRRK